MQTHRDDLRVVPLDAGVYEVRLDTDRGELRIGRAMSSDGKRTWMWQHRDGERSSPVAASLSDVVHALASYHDAFKTQPTPTRSLLFNRDTHQRATVPTP
jgi:hypothetical protein